MISLKTQKPVFCLGDVLPDLILPFHSAKKYLEDVRAGRPAGEPTARVNVQCGGTSGTTAVGLSKLQVGAMIGAKVGNDFQGRLLRQDLIDNGVDVSYLITDETQPTMLSLVVPDETGDRIMFAWPDRDAAHTRITTEDLPDSLIEQIGWAHLCGPATRFDPIGTAVIDFAKRCKKAGVPVSVDLNLHTEGFGWDEEYRDRILSVVECATVVFGALKEEFSFLTPDPHTFVADDRWVVVREGKGGCSLFTAEGDYSVGIYDVTVSDTVGAGDSFNSGFIAAAVLGMSPKDCLVWGNACGNYSVQYPGGHAGPDRETLLRFLKEKGVPEKK